MRVSIILALAVIISAIIGSSTGSTGSRDIDIVGSKLSNIEILTSGDSFGDFEKKLDIVGSKLDNINIYSSNTDSENVEIVGSEIKNMRIYPLEDTSSCYWYPLCKDYPPAPCIKPHLGVDAWYGKYWYMDNMYTPKWPRVF